MSLPANPRATFCLPNFIRLLLYKQSRSVYTSVDQELRLEYSFTSNATTQLLLTAKSFKRTKRYNVQERDSLPDSKPKACKNYLRHNAHNDAPRKVLQCSVTNETNRTQPSRISQAVRNCTDEQHSDRSKERMGFEVAFQDYNITTGLCKPELGGRSAINLFWRKQINESRVCNDVQSRALSVPTSEPDENTTRDAQTFLKCGGTPCFWGQYGNDVFLEAHLKQYPLSLPSRCNAVLCKNGYCLYPSHRHGLLGKRWRVEIPHCIIKPFGKGILI